MIVTSLFSGSGGNAVFVRREKTAVLIDAGVSFARLSRALQEIGEEISALSGVLITHEHIDHVAAVAQLVKRTELCFYLAADCALALYTQYQKQDPGLADCFASKVRTVEPGKSYECDDIVFSPFLLSHDSVCCYGYRIGDDAEENCLGIATDLGQMTTEVRRELAVCENVIVESNHDPELLKNGPYPRYLQERIRSPYGHLANGDCAALLQTTCTRRVKNALLFHLSRENNRPELAQSCAEEALCAIGAEKDVRVSVAAPESPCFFVTE